MMILRILTLATWYMHASAVLTPLSAAGDDNDCALYLSGPGRTSAFDYNLNLLRGNFAYDGQHTCITYEAVNQAYIEARKRILVSQPKGDWKAEDFASVGELILDISISLARTYGLTYEEIEKGLPLIDTSRTLIREVCPPIFSHVECRAGKYRRFDGLCNNLQHPTWGAAMSPFQRLIGPLFADGINAPRISHSGRDLPLSRVVSRTMHPDEGFHDHAGTVMVIAWGQFMDHDYTLTGTPLDPKNRNDPEECCKRPPHLKHPYCNEIRVPDDDYFYRLWGVKCIDFVRGFPSPRPGCRLGSRVPFNTLTGVIDGNTVYGVTEKFSRKLRTGFGGLLRMNPVFKEYGLKDLLPLKLDIPDEGCTRPNKNMYCFEAGEIRVNEQLVLTVMHTLMAREHNRVAKGLAAVNPHWDDETLFQEARRINIAEIQHITYNEFLPILLGKDVMEKFGLVLEKDGYWDGYDPTVNPDVIDSFASAAYRFGHSLLPTAVERWSKAHKFIASKRLSDLIRRPYDLYRAGVLDEYVMGLMNQVAQAMDDSITQEVTNHLFKKVGARYGHDLVSFNMQRGREFGIPGYMEFRKFCGLPDANTFQDLFGSMPNETVRKYETIFEHPIDVDLWSGGVSERPLPGSMLGPTFACVIATQFSYSRRGDRFWFELPNQPASFTPEQLKEIRKSRLARVICDNTDIIDTVQLYPMVLPDHELNPRVPCRSGVMPSMDFSKWAEPAHFHSPAKSFLTEAQMLSASEKDIRSENPNKQERKIEYSHNDSLAKNSNSTHISEKILPETNIENITKNIMSDCNETSSLNCPNLEKTKFDIAPPVDNYLQKNDDYNIQNKTKSHMKNSLKRRRRETEQSESQSGETLPLIVNYETSHTNRNLPTKLENAQLHFPIHASHFTHLQKSNSASIEEPLVGKETDRVKVNKKYYESINSPNHDIPPLDDSISRIVSTNFYEKSKKNISRHPGIPEGIITTHSYSDDLSNINIQRNKRPHQEKFKEYREAKNIEVTELPKLLNSDSSSEKLNSFQNKQYSREELNSQNDVNHQKSKTRNIDKEHFEYDSENVATTIAYNAHISEPEIISDQDLNRQKSKTRNIDDDHFEYDSETVATTAAYVAHNSEPSIYILQNLDRVKENTNKNLFKKINSLKAPALNPQSNFLNKNSIGYKNTYPSKEIVVKPEKYTNNAINNAHLADFNIETLHADSAYPKTSRENIQYSAYERPKNLESEEKLNNNGEKSLRVSATDSGVNREIDSSTEIINTTEENSNESYDGEYSGEEHNNANKLSDNKREKQYKTNNVRNNFSKELHNMDTTLETLESIHSEESPSERLKDESLSSNEGVYQEKENKKSNINKKNQNIYQNVSSSEEKLNDSTGKGKIEEFSQETHENNKNPESKRLDYEENELTEKPKKEHVIQDVNLQDFSYEKIKINEKGQVEPLKDSDDNIDSVEVVEKSLPYNSNSSAETPNSNVNSVPKSEENNEELLSLRSISKELLKDFEDEANPEVHHKVNGGEIKPVVEISNENHSDEHRIEDNSEESHTSYPQSEKSSEINYLQDSFEKSDKFEKLNKKEDVKQQFERIPLNYNHNKKETKGERDNISTNDPTKSQLEPNDVSDITPLPRSQESYDENLNIKFNDVTIKLPEIKLPEDILTYVYEKPSYLKEKENYYTEDDDKNKQTQSNQKHKNEYDDYDEHHTYYGHEDDKESYKQNKKNSEEGKEEDNDENVDLYEKFVRERFGKRGSFGKRSEQLNNKRHIPHNEKLYENVQNILKKTEENQKQAEKSGDPNAGYMWTLEYGENV